MNSLFIRQAVRFLIIIAIAGIFGCGRESEPKNASVRVKVRNSGGETLYLEKITLDGTLLLDSARIDKQGEVRFDIHTDDFDFLLLGDGSQENILLVVAKDEEVEVFTTQGHFTEEYTLRGSPGSALLRDLEMNKRKTLSRLDSIGQVWMQERYSDDNMEKKILFDSIAEEVIENHRRFLRNFADKYPESPALIIAAYQMLRAGQPFLTYESDYDLFLSISESLHSAFPDNAHVRDFRRRTVEYKEEITAFKEREELLQPGRVAPEISLFDIRGERRSLASYEGKFILIYFWDARKQESWEFNRQLAGLYQKYRYRNFEIMGIYTGDDKQLYYNAIRVDGLPWIHLFGNSVVEKQYNVTKVPAMLLVDREGKIIQRNITIEELAAKLPYILPATRVAQDTAVINRNQ